jgi:hypothetical protein
MQESKNSSDNDNNNNDNVDTINIDTFLLNNGWNDHNERLIVSIGETAAGYKWMHLQCTQRYNLLNKIINISLILLTTALSAQTAIGNNDKCSLNLSQQILTYVITGLTVLNNFLNFEKKSINHLTAENSYSELYHDIQQQMCYFRKDRPPAAKYVSSKFKKFDHLTLINPNIDKDIIDKFNKTTKKQFNTPTTEISIINENLQIRRSDSLTTHTHTPTVNPIDTVVINMENGPSIPISNKDKKSNLYCMNSIVNKNYRIEGDLDSFNTNEYLRRKALEAQMEFEYKRNDN